MEQVPRVDMDSRNARGRMAALSPVGSPSRLPGLASEGVRVAAGAYIPRPWRCRMSEFVKGFGCRPHTAVPRTPAAGVRKPPREETAMGEGAAVPRGRYGDLSATAVGTNGA